MPRTSDLWADENRILPKGSAEPGRWRSSRNPYMIAIVRAFSKPAVRRIIFIMGSQMGKSVSMQNIIGHRLDDDPVPIIYVGPTQSNIDNVVEPKIMDMFKNCPSLWDKLAKGQKSTKHHKKVSGVSLRLAWAGSATELASDSAGIGLVDELDRMEQDVKGEGSPVELTEARTSVYADGKIGVTSTPTEGNVEVIVHEKTGIAHWGVSDMVVSPVWRLWQEGSRHEWAVPCPECHEYFIPRFRLLWWPEGSTAQQVSKTARLNCPNCGGQCEDKHKSWMNRYGVFVAPGQKPNTWEPGEGILVRDHNSMEEEMVPWNDYMETDTPNHSFWVSGIMSFSSKKSFGFLAAKFLQAAASGEPERIKGVINTDFGELYRVSGDAPKWTKVKTCIADYLSSTVPPGVKRVVCGVDVQKNRLVYVVRGFGDGKESWKIEDGELWGSTDKQEVWDQLEDLLKSEWGGFHIAKMAIDSGYRPEMVYAFCRKHRIKALAVKGHDSLDKPYYASKIDVTINGKTHKGGLQLWHFSSDITKSWVHARVNWDEEAGETCTWHISNDTSDEYCKQVVAEQRAIKPSGKVIWIKVSNENHYLDCEGLCYLAINIAGGVGKVRHQAPVKPQQEEKAITHQEETKFIRREKQQNKPKSSVKSRKAERGGWMSKYR